METYVELLFVVVNEWHVLSSLELQYDYGVVIQGGTIK